MHLTSSVLLIAFFTIPAVLATYHTACYNFYLHGRKKCVWGAADNRHRCKPPSQAKGVGMFTHQAPKHAKGRAGLQRRYDTTKPVFPIAGGHGICNKKDDPKDVYSTYQPGACVWSGLGNGTRQTSAGWVNGVKTSNCGKQLYIKRTTPSGQSVTLYVPILDGCSFETTVLETGCAQIAVTTKTFNDLLPSPAEKRSQKLQGIVTWDFDNYDGTHGWNAPV